ncbi:hypothetical protein Pan44_21000 [Caulifigura coniformis]|uniref:Nickel uptake substrate-specific transmembrane region n=1 Tax=Caulifigura coniformis TaxID=2527983 RepID=A0A517SD70_9PLAN|nr:carboxypeptidase regulatory-like domain-containing protein [Caulifigura coniformis]QDT54073.1 hypothetical protein Pan44_21000 [Caulifigura coniformis]
MSRFSLCAALALMAGCGGSASDQWTKDRPKTSPAEAVVTHDGRGIEGASVTFAPVGRDGTAAFGLTDAEGKVVLSTFGDKDGAVAGDYMVTVTKKSVDITPNPKDPNGPPLKSVEKSLIPARYSSSGTSQLKATIKDGGENKFTFDLKG